MSDPNDEEIELLDEEHVYLVNGEPWRSVTTVIRGVMGNPYARAKPDDLERARERGKYVHLAVQYLNEDDLDWDWLKKECASIVPYVESYAEWKSATNFKPDRKLIERKVLIPALRVGGTLDFGGELFGKLALLDAKTGQCDEKEIGAQTAGYCIGLGEERRDRYGLKLIPGKMAKLIPCKNPDDFAAFRAMCTVHAWKNK